MEGRSGGRNVRRARKPANNNSCIAFLEFLLPMSEDTLVSVKVLSSEFTIIQDFWKLFKLLQPGAPAAGGESSTSRNRENCCRKWCYFSELYKMTKVLEDGIEKMHKKSIYQ